MIRASKNLSKRIELLHKSLNRFKAMKNNSIKIDREEYEEVQRQLAICRQLYRKEVVRVPLQGLLKWQ